MLRHENSTLREENQVWKNQTLELHGQQALQLTTVETSSSRYIADWRPKQRRRKKATPSREATRVGPFYHESIEALEAAAEAFVRDSQFCEHLLKSSMDRWPQDPRVGVALTEAQLFIPKIMLHSVALWSSRLIGAFDDRRFNGLPMHFRPWQCSGMLVPQPPWQSSGMLVPQPMRILGIVYDSVAT